MDCIFCKIINKELPSFQIYEDNEVVAFLDIKPITEGHTLVVPQKHSETFLDSDDETLAMLGPKIKKIAKAVVESMGAEDCNISVNNGRTAGQDVFHLHVHIIPRTGKDNLPDWPNGEYTEGEAERLADKIRKQISSN